MFYISSKEVRQNPAVLWKNKETLITSKGTPVALVLKLESPQDAQEIILSLKQLKAMKSVEKIRMFSKENGLDKLTENEIENVIQDVRKQSGS